MGYVARNIYNVIYVLEGIINLVLSIFSLKKRFSFSEEYLLQYELNRITSEVVEREKERDKKAESALDTIRQEKDKYLGETHARNLRPKE